MDKKDFDFFKGTLQELSKSMEVGLSLDTIIGELHKIRWNIYNKLNDEEKNSFNIIIAWFDQDNMRNTNSISFAYKKTSNNNDAKQKIALNIKSLILWLDSYMQNSEKELIKKPIKKENGFWRWAHPIFWIYGIVFLFFYGLKKHFKLALFVICMIIALILIKIYGWRIDSFNFSGFEIIPK